MPALALCTEGGRACAFGGSSCASDEDFGRGASSSLVCFLRACSGRQNGAAFGRREGTATPQPRYDVYEEPNRRLLMCRRHTMTM